MLAASIRPLLCGRAFLPELHLQNEKKKELSLRLLIG